MIVGIGIDLVEVDRIDTAWKRFGDRFLQRILLPDEISYCLSHAKPAPFLAARFACKEAVSKAFGTGIGALLGWHDIEVKHKPSGQPFILLHGKGLVLLTNVKANTIHLSISHTATNAGAVAVVEQVPNLTDA